MELYEETLFQRIRNLQEHIHDAEHRAGRQKGSTALVAVSKTFSASLIREAHQAAALFRFGENRVQEMLEKQKALVDLPLEWHLVGQLQTNKVKDILGCVALIHSLDRIKLAQELQRQAIIRGLSEVRCLVEVNVAAEPSKAGLLLDEVPSFIEGMQQFPALRIEGLMTIAPYSGDPEKVRPVFRSLSLLRLSLQSKSWPWAPLSILSMGMSNDFEVAVEEGADLVRIGSAVFGTRI